MRARLAPAAAGGYGPAMTRLLIPALAAALLGLAACDQSPKPPTTRGACFHFVQNEDGTVKFNTVASNQPSLEYCAARLEIMRRGFLSLGSPRQEVIGAYQGRWLFVERRGVFSAKSLKGGRFLALPRAPDGRLIIPGQKGEDASF